MRISKEEFCKCAKSLHAAMQYIDEDLNEKEIKLTIGDETVYRSDDHYMCYMEAGSVIIETFFDLVTDYHDKKPMLPILTSLYQFIMWDYETMADYVGIIDDIPKKLRNKLLKCCSYESFYDLIEEQERTLLQNNVIEGNQM